MEPRVILVRSTPNQPYIQRVLKDIDDQYRAICYRVVETLEELNKTSEIHKTGDSFWRDWKEMEYSDPTKTEQIKQQFTFLEIAEGKAIGVPEHLIEIIS